MNRKRTGWMAGIVLALPGCGTATDGLLGGSIVMPAVREACTDAMSESEMFTALTIAQLDRINGYTQSEELQAAAQGCTTDSITGDQTYEQCLECKSAILDQAYGQ